MMRMSLLPLPNTDEAHGLRIRRAFTGPPQYARMLTSLFYRPRGRLRGQALPDRLRPGLRPKSLHSLLSPELSL